METIFQFLKVTKKYNNKTVLDQLDFSVKRHAFTALIGNNGCGKTTTLNVLCNLSTYDSGDVLFAGKKVTRNYVSYKSKLGIVLSKPYYIDEFSIVDYLKFVSKFQHVPKNERDDRISDLLILFELENDKNKAIKNLSSGMQVKTSLAASLIHNPELLVLDEPFVNLDINMTHKLNHILSGFKGKKSIFITSHNLDLVANLCDEFLIMHQGKIVKLFLKADFQNSGEIKDTIKAMLQGKPLDSDLTWLT